MSFLETPRFPENISLRSIGGPELARTRVQVQSGRSYSNEDWLYPLHRYNVAYGVREPDEIYALAEFFLAVGANVFRYKDWLDYKSCAVNLTPTFLDQPLGVGNGSNKDFAIYKTYTKGAMTRQRAILSPVLTGFLVGKDGVNQASGWSLIMISNVYIVRFTVAPAGGAVLTWGSEFDVPCEFEEDSLPVSIDSSRLRSANIPLREARALA